MLIYKAFRWVQHLQNLTFSDLNPIKNPCFLCLILDRIFRHFGASRCPNARFWDPLGAQLGPKWHPKSRHWRPKCIKNIVLASHFFKLFFVLSFCKLQFNLFFFHRDLKNGTFVNQKWKNCKSRSFIRGRCAHSKWKSPQSRRKTRHSRRTELEFFSSF